MSQQPQYEQQSGSQDKWIQQPTQTVKSLKQSKQFVSEVDEQYTTSQFHSLSFNKKQPLQNEVVL